MKVSPVKSNDYDVIVVGCGTAASASAISAREQGAKVLMIDKVHSAERGGNGRFTGGGFRFCHSGRDEILSCLRNIPESELSLIDVDPYTEDDFYADIMRVTDGLADAGFTELIVKQSNAVFKWLDQLGFTWDANYAMAMRVNGRMSFSQGTVPLNAKGAGEGFVDEMVRIAEGKGVEIRYQTKAMSLLMDGWKVCGVKVLAQRGLTDIYSKAVVLASGGFQSNAEMRTKYLGGEWDMIKLRGTRHNTGEGIKMALTIGAQPVGEWSGCHATLVDWKSPAFGGGLHTDRKSYTFGIVVNTDGRRWADEGEDFNGYTYAKMGRQNVKQPGALSFQVFDEKAVPFLMSDYAKQVPVKANTVEELAQELDIDPANLTKTFNEYNAAVQDIPFDAARRDGKCTRGVTPPKSNWAQTLDKPPFKAYPVTTGITFTFGGIKTDKNGQVLDTEDKPIPGLYANGEMVGGVYYRNYAGGSGITKNLVMGRIAGASAARAAP